MATVTPYVTTRSDDGSGRDGGSGADDARSASEDPVDAHVFAEAHPSASAADARDARHDAVLAAVPAPLAAGAAVGLLSPVSMALSLCFGSVIAAGIVGWALFFAPPV